MRLSFDPGAAEGVLSPGVTGSLPPADALQQLLAGTGFMARFAPLPPPPPELGSASFEIAVPVQYRLR
jgi:hypothetical protein